MGYGIVMEGLKNGMNEDILKATQGQMIKNQRLKEFFNEWEIVSFIPKCWKNDKGEIIAVYNEEENWICDINNKEEDK